LKKYEAAIAAVPEDVGLSFKPPEMPKALTQAAQAGEQMASGKLPDEVVREIQTRSAEAGLAAGLGVKGSGYRTLRDLGVKSLEYRQAGANVLTQVGQAQGAFTMQTEELRQKSQLAEREMENQRRQLNLQYASAVGELQQGGSKLALAAAELQSLNRHRRLEAERLLTTANAAQAIPGIEQYLKNIGGYGMEDGTWQQGYFEQMNQAAQAVIDRYRSA